MPSSPNTGGAPLRIMHNEAGSKPGDPLKKRGNNDTRTYEKSTFTTEHQSITVFVGEGFPMRRSGGVVPTSLAFLLAALLPGAVRAELPQSGFAPNLAVIGIRDIQR